VSATPPRCVVPEKRCLLDLNDVCCFCVCQFKFQNLARVLRMCAWYCFFSSINPPQTSRKIKQQRCRFVCNYKPVSHTCLQSCTLIACVLVASHSCFVSLLQALDCAANCTPVTACRDLILHRRKHDIMLELYAQLVGRRVQCGRRKLSDCNKVRGSARFAFTHALRPPNTALLRDSARYHTSCLSH
jgi:hypothetical protein